jgi:hypothetical protein
MTNSKAESVDLEKLVKDIPLVSLDVPVPKKPLTKKRIRRIAEPHIPGSPGQRSCLLYFLPRDRPRDLSRRC